MKYHQKYAVKTAKRSYKLTSLVALLLIWLVAWTIGIPVLNGNIVKLQASQCIFEDDDFVIYSSVVSYFGPAFVMLVFHLWTVYERKKQVEQLFQEHSSIFGSEVNSLQDMALQKLTVDQENGSKASSLRDASLKTLRSLENGSQEPANDEKTHENEKEIVTDTGTPNSKSLSNGGGCSREDSKRCSLTSAGHGTSAFKARRLKYWMYKNGKHFYHGKVMTKRERRDRNLTKTLTVVVGELFWSFLSFSIRCVFHRSQFICCPASSLCCSVH